MVYGVHITFQSHHATTVHSLGSGHTHTHTHKHTYTYTHIQTHTHTHIYISNFVDRSNLAKYLRKQGCADRKNF